MPVKQANRDLRLGRLYMVSLEDQVSETVGDALESDATGVAIARRRPRQFTFVFPVRGANADPNPYAAGERMRRQVRAMMENSILRLQALYLAFTPDPDLAGWVVLGSGILKYDPNGLTFGMFEMELDSAFKVGTLRTSLPARRVELYDRRTGKVPRDARGNILSTDFSTITPLALTAIPVGAIDPVGYNWQPVVARARTGFDGTGYVIEGMQHSQVVAYDQEEENQNLGDVVVYDRQGLGGAVGNYVLNPSFERDTIGSAPAVWSTNTPGWFLNTGSTLTVRGTTFGGNQVGLQHLEVVTTNALAFEGTVLNMGTLPGGTYTFSVYLKGNAGNEKIQLCAGQANASGKITARTLTNGYVRYTTTFTTDGTGACYCGFRTETAAVVTVYMDGAQVTAGAPATLPEYEDGDQPGYTWTGTPGNSTSVTISLPELAGNTNLCPNPNFNYDTVGAAPAVWSATLANPATLRTEEGGAEGSGRSMKITTPGSLVNEGAGFAGPPLEASQMYRADVWLKGSAGGELVQVVIGSSGAGGATATNVTLTTSWQRVGVTFLSAASVSGKVCMSIRTQGTSAYTFYADMAQLTVGNATQIAYYDGDSHGYFWTGTPGASVTVIDPQNFGWEEVYGRDQKHTSGDAVVISNQLCRVRYIAETTSFAIDLAEENGRWTEQGRVTLWDSEATDTYTRHQALIPRAGGALSTVEEWTPERALIKVSSQRTAGNEAARIDTYISLQRGWLGPRFESYCTIAGKTTPGCQVRWSPAEAGNHIEANITPSGTIYAGGDALFPWNSSPGPTYGSVGEPWVNIVPAGTGQMVSLTSLMELARGPNYEDTAAYGSTRQSAAVAARYNETQVAGQLVYGYVSMHVGFTGVKPKLGVFEAEAWRVVRSGTSEVADAAASAGEAVNDLQSSPVNVPVQANLTSSGTGGNLAAGTYFYKVTAKTAAGETTASNEKSITVSGTTSKITVSWAEVFGATGYVVYRGTSSNGENVKHEVSGGSTLSLEDLGGGGFPESLTVSDTFLRTESPLSNAGKWSLLTSDTNTGSTNVTNGWEAVSFGSTSGARWNVAEQSNPAVTLTLNSGTPSTERWFAVWACMAAAAKTGYAVRMTETASNVYTCTITRWEAGVEHVIKTITGVSFTTGNTLGIGVRGGRVSAWKKVSGVWSEIGNEADATFTTGYTGIEGSGSNPFYTNFSFGEMIAGTTFVSGTPPVSNTATIAEAATLLISNTNLNTNEMKVGKYAMWARVRVTTIGDTLKVYAGFATNQTAGVTTTSSTYKWLYLGESLRETTSQEWSLTIFKSAGTGTTGVRVDRIVMLPTELRQSGWPTYDGGRDLAVQHLYDSQAVPELVER